MREIIKKMWENFEEKTRGLTITPQAVIVASMLEKEVRKAEDMALVAGIIYKRLKLGMPLQIDATVQYAVGSVDDWWPILTREDLEINSPYNSYKNQGFPPTPIANPGLASINAAKKPEESDYWFYLHDSSGQIHYAATLEEHNENIFKYLRKN